MNERTRYLRLRRMRKQHRKMAKAGLPALAIFNLDLIGQKVSVDGFFEIAELKALEEHLFPVLAKKAVILDIGANIGNHSVFFAPHFSQVLAFEPNPRTAKLLEANAMLAGNIEPHAIGLSNEKARLKASFDTDNVGQATVAKDVSGDVTVDFDVDRLDNVLSKKIQGQISVIKIDVEGHELEALEGAVNTLEASSPVILMEALRKEITDGNTPAKAFLESQGYQFFYDLQPVTPFKGLTPKFVQGLNSLGVLLIGRKFFGKLTPQKLDGGLPSGGCKMLIASKSPISFTV